MRALLWLGLVAVALLVGVSLLFPRGLSTPGPRPETARQAPRLAAGPADRAPSLSETLGPPAPRPAELVGRRSAAPVAAAKPARLPHVELSADCADLWQDLVDIDPRDLSSADDVEARLPDLTGCRRLPAQLPDGLIDRHFDFRDACARPKPARAWAARIWGADCARALYAYRSAIRDYQRRVAASETAR